MKRKYNFPVYIYNSIKKDSNNLISRSHKIDENNAFSSVVELCFGGRNIVFHNSIQKQKNQSRGGAFNVGICLSPSCLPKNQN